MNAQSARRRFLLMVGASVLVLFGTAWSLVLQDWGTAVLGAGGFCLVLTVILPNLVATGWPDSSFPLHVRLSRAQRILLGLALFAPLLISLSILSGGEKVRGPAIDLIAVTAITAWLLWTIHGEGWSGAKRNKQ